MRMKMGWGVFFAVAFACSPLSRAEAADGSGSATISPMETVGISASGSWTLVFAADQALQVGGGVRFDIPPQWTKPQNSSQNSDGYIVTSNSAGVSTTVTITQRSIYVRMASVLSSGAKLTLIYGKPSGQNKGLADAPDSATSFNPFLVYSDVDGATDGREIGGTSYKRIATELNLVVAGLPTNLRFGSLQQSIPRHSLGVQVIWAADESGNPSRGVGANITITFSASGLSSQSGLPSGSRPSMTMYADANGTLVVPNRLTLISGTSALTFYIRDGEGGRARLTAKATVAGKSRQASTEVVVLDGGLAQVSIDSGRKGGLTWVTLAADAKGKRDAAYVNFTIEEKTDWQVVMDTDRDGTFAMSVDPSKPGDVGVFGNGRENRVKFEGVDDRKQPLANGVYRFRVAVGSWVYEPRAGKAVFQIGSVTDTSLSMVILSAGLTGTVRDSDGAALSNVPVYVSGQNVRLSSESAANGNFRINGLNPGSYKVSAKKTGYAEAQIQAEVSGSSETAVQLTLIKGTAVRVEAVRPSGAYATEIFGGVSAHRLDGGKLSGFGTVHFTSGTATLSDNGATVNDQDEYRPYTEIGLAVGSYRFEVERLGGLAVSGWTVPGTTLSGSGATAELSLSAGTVLTLRYQLNRLASLQGTAILASPAEFPQGGFLGLLVKPVSDLQETVAGGVWFSAGNPTMAFEIPGVADGAYTVSGRLEGYAEYIHPVQVTVAGGTATPASLTISSANFSRGASLTGWFTLAEGGTLSSSQQRVWLNVWSPLGLRGGTAVMLTGSSARYLIGGLTAGTYEVETMAEGYELEAFSDGSRTVKIEAGQATSQHLTLKATSGRIAGTVTFPSADASPDYGSVRIRAKPLYFGSGSGGVKGSQQELTTSVTLADGGTGYGYALTGLNTGGYVVTAIYAGNAKSYPFKSAPLQVASGETTSWNINLGGSVWRVTGTVTTASTDSRWSTMVNITSNADRETGMVGVTGKSLFRVVAMPVNGLGLNAGMGSDLGSGKSGGLGFFGEIVPGTLDVSVGEYTIPNLPKGTYRVFVPGELTLRNAATADPNAWPDVVSTERLVQVIDQDVSEVNLQVSGGYVVSGAVSLPEAGTAYGRVMLQRVGGATASSFVLLTFQAGAPQPFMFRRLAPGKYVIQIWTDRYAMINRVVEVGSADVPDVNLLLRKGATLKAKLKDAETGILLTANNQQAYLGGVDIYAMANPWVENGFRGAKDPFTEQFVDAQKYINIRHLPAGTYDLVVKTQEQGFDRGMSKNYVPKMIAGIVVSEEDAASGFVKDLGVIELVRGEQVTGKVTESGTGHPISNVLVVAFPTNRGTYSVQSSARTDKKGRYTLLGLDLGAKFYSIVAAPRGAKFGSDAAMDMMMSGAKYAEGRKDDVDITAVRKGLDFALSRAGGGVSGTVVLTDGGSLAPGVPVSTGSSVGANVFLREISRFIPEEPLGNISILTQPDGEFSIEGISPGTYLGVVAAEGYALRRFRVGVSASGISSVGSLTLSKGGKVSGAIAKSDGTFPNVQEVGGMVAVAPEAGEMLFGRLTVDDATKQVTEYVVDGLSPQTTYHLIMYAKEEGKGGSSDAMVEGGSVQLSLATESRIVDLVYRQAAPVFVAKFKKTGSRLSLRWFGNQPLRKLTEDDQDASKLLRLKSGNGTLSGQEISEDRRSLRAVYLPGPGESKFVVTVTGFGQTMDPSTNDYAVVNQDFEFYSGFDGQGVERINNWSGGEVKIEGDASKAMFPSGAFGDVPTSIVNVELYKVAATAQGAPRFSAAAYPEAAFRRFAKSPVLSGVFSNYYDVFMQVGQLASGKSYSLQLAYDASVEDPTGLNVYYLDESSGLWKKEVSNRQVDTSNRTITVQLEHASRFVVVNSQASTIGGDQYAGGDVTVFSFPNPFDLKPKTVTLSKVAGGATATITGTEIRYALPSASSGDVQFKIYNVAGELVRTMIEANKPGGYYYYVEWDGRNDEGSEVASGVYVCVMKAGGVARSFKMAVVK